MRMGLKLNEDRWAVEVNANYKYETVWRNSAFDFALTVNDNIARQGENQARLFYLLEELREGRFWFGAGKSKGLGRRRVVWETAIAAPAAAPKANAVVNHLRVTAQFNASNPILVGWNWGKVDPETPAFAAIEGRALVQAMRDLPEVVRKRLEMSLGGPILNPADFKRKLASLLPRILAIHLRDQAGGETEFWTLSEKGYAKLQKEKNPVGARVLEVAKTFIEKPFPHLDAAEGALEDALGNKANMAGRIIKVMENRKQAIQTP
jgi:hypothetical protein